MSIFTTLMPFISTAIPLRVPLSARVFSFAISSICFLYASFSSTILRIAPARSGTLLKNDLAVRIVSAISSTSASAPTPVVASIRRTPAAIADSETILKKPIWPVAAACVPPQSSQESPNLITRTVSPYFSPKSAIAPIASACSIVALRFSSSG